MRTSSVRPSAAALFLAAVAVFAVVPAARAAQPTATTLLYRFTDPAANVGPGPVVPGADGNFYGVTGEGGANRYGSFFKMTPQGAVTTLHDFGPDSRVDGAYVNRGIARGADGNFYGTTISGGADGAGIIFRVTPAGVVTALHSFLRDQDGFDHEQGLTLGSDGNFYGATNAGFFRITPGGVYTIFAVLPNPNLSVWGDLVTGGDGALYGLVSGSNQPAAVFRLTLDGNYSVVYGDGSAGGISSLIAGRDGNLYFSAFGDGIGCKGAIYKLTTAGVLSTLHAFTDNVGPGTALVQKASGALYGVTQCVYHPDTGKYDPNFVFEITPAGAFTQLATVTDDEGAGYTSSLVAMPDGSLIGNNVDSLYRVIFGASLTIKPKLGHASGGDTVCATATKNGATAPISGFTLNFNRTGPNPASTQVVTDAQGQATTCWAGVHYVWNQADEVDKTTVSDGSKSDTSSITWYRSDSALQADGMIVVLPGTGGVVQLKPTAKLGQWLFFPFPPYYVFNPLAGKNVSFYTGGQFLCAGVSDTNGRAKCTATIRAHVDAILNKGYDAIFGGDAYFLPSQAHGKAITAAP